MKKVGDNIKSSVGAFNFAGNVHKSFEKHVKKSVPFYEEGHDIICKLSSFFLVNKSVVYDLGCSTGPLSVFLGDRHWSLLNLIQSQIKFWGDEKGSGEIH